MAFDHRVRGLQVNSAAFRPVNHRRRIPNVISWSACASSMRRPPSTVFDRGRWITSSCTTCASNRALEFVRKSGVQHGAGSTLPRQVLDGKFAFPQCAILQSFTRSIVQMQKGSQLSAVSDLQGCDDSNGRNYYFIR